MPTDNTFQQRVEQMLAAGKLTAEEAQRLGAALQAQEQRDNPLRGAGATRHRRPLTLLLTFLAFAFALGALSAWLYTSLADAPVGALVSADTVAPKDVGAENIGAGEAPAVGRPIDLQRLDEERNITMKRSLPVLTAVIPLVALSVLGILLAVFYNALINAREQVNAGWAQVENVYQRRLDLVPVLVDTVQTYTEHERETLTELTQARAQALQLSGMSGDAAPATAEQFKAIEASQGKVDSALARLLAVVESYPDLKASGNFLSLQDQLEGTENRVAIERRSYNEFSRRYNTRLQSFPSNLVATMMGFESKPYFQAEDRALQAPDDPFGRRDG